MFKVKIKEGASRLAGGFPEVTKDAYTTMTDYMYAKAQQSAQQAGVTLTAEKVPESNGGKVTTGSTRTASTAGGGTEGGEQ